MSSGPVETSLERGAAVIRRYVEMLPDAPGVYRMLGQNGEVLYVGKARSLKRRVVTYSRPSRLPLRLQRMISQTEGMEFIHTHTEVEALLLESNLIKKLLPPYNVLLKDDKSYPYLLLTAGHDFPQVLKYRGKQDRLGQYYGPFASNVAVNETLKVIQKAFLLRNCTDSYFSARKRPCLQYHIKLCSAPCVGYATKEAYAEQVRDAEKFLSGKTRDVQEKLQATMQEASSRQDYEAAALVRDRIKALAVLQARQDINISEISDADVVALAQSEGRSCVQVFFFRAGQNYGNRAFFPSHPAAATGSEILTAFLLQFYDGKPLPPEVLLSHPVSQKDLLEAALSGGQEASKKVRLVLPEKGARRRLVEFAVKNAHDALGRNLLERKTDSMLLDKVAALFNMDQPPQRIEIYDNSHISGTNMVGAMVVAGPEGFQKKAYRRFNIKSASAADDYGMMQEVMRRRFSGAEEGPRDGPDWPDLLLIDGGLGQLNAVTEVLAELNVLNDLVVVGIAKGPERNAGREKFFMQGREEFSLPTGDPVLHYLQRLRDEAHRFVIGSHRIRRMGDVSRSALDEVPGVGPKRKKALLLHFGTARAVQDAGLSDLQKVEGVSREMAQKIYNFFHQS